MSPAPINLHQDAVGSAYAYLRALSKRKGFGKVVISLMDVFLGEDVLQPDLFWVSGDTRLCQLGIDGYWHGAPDLVVEVSSPSTENRDRKDKFLIYQENGVREYWLVELGANLKIEVYNLTEGIFVKQNIFQTRETFLSSVLDNELILVSELLEQ